jgi:hypothetical protein
MTNTQSNENERVAAALLPRTCNREDTKMWAAARLANRGMRARRLNRWFKTLRLGYSLRYRAKDRH